MVPPGPALDHLGRSLARLRDRLPDPAHAPRWAGREAQHVTLAFFGEVPVGQVPALTAALGDRAPATRWWRRGAPRWRPDRNGTPSGAVGTHRPTSRQDRSYQA